MGDDYLKEELSIIDILDMMIRHWWILLITALSFSIVAFVYAEVFVDPLYRTDGSLYVTAQRTQSNDVTQGNQIASYQLVNTYKEILTRRTFLSGVSQDMGGRYSISDLKRMISMNSVNDTEILEIAVTGKVPTDIYQICHSILLRSSDELVRVVNAGSVKILDDGQIPTTPISPNVKGYTLFAALIGIVFGALIILILELFDTRIKTREDIIEKYDEPLLGEIPILIPVSSEGESK